MYTTIRRRKIGKITIPLIIFLIVVDIVLLGGFLKQNFHFAILEPAGIIAQLERNLLVSVLALGLTVVGTVILVTFLIVWKYREDNTSSTYEPEWSGGKHLILLWWGIPALIVVVLSVITWRTTHALDPYKPIAGNVKPIRIQVVALQWKWLFIYPEQNIATVNFVVFPEKTPITFELTADAPMNSFWIPRLGGQMYAMSGMITKSHLMADAPGEFAGLSAEISGEGFAGMRFIAKSTTPEDFISWVEAIKQSSSLIDRATYEVLARPSENNKAAFYAPVEENLYNEIIMKYMPSYSSDTEHAVPSVNH